MLKLKTADTDTNKVKLLYDLGLHYLPIEPQKAAGYLDEAIYLAEKINWQKGLSQSYITRGEVYNESGQHDEALKCYDKALVIANKTKNKLLIARTLNNIGTVHSQKTDYVKATEFYLRTLKLAEEIDNKNLLATGLLNLGIISQKQNDFKKSHDYKLKALRIYEQEKNQDKIAQTLNGIGLNYQQEGKTDEAKKYFYQALHIYEKENNKTGIAILYSQIAVLYEPDYQKIISLQLKSKEIWDEINPTHYNAMVNLGNLGYTYLMLASSNKNEKNSNLQKAEHTVKEAIQLAKTIKNKEFESYFTGILAEVQEHQGDFKNAYLNFRKYHESNDSIYSQEVKNKISNIQSEREIALLDQQIAVEKLKMKQLWLYSIISIVILIGVFMYLLNRYRLKQLRLKNEIERKEAEMTKEALLIQNRITESELKAIRSQMNPHFIFNVFNSIEAYIVAQDTDKASDLIRKFARLSRMILENSTQHLAVASREWTINQLYTEIEHARFDESFTYDFTVEGDLDLDEILLPPMMIQPLIENAIHHGIRHTGQASPYLSVMIKKQLNQIQITVQDNGKGLYNPDQKVPVPLYKKKSFGLSSIKERIDILNQADYDSVAKFELIDLSTQGQKGALAVLSLPLIYINEVVE